MEDKRSRKELSSILKTVKKMANSFGKIGLVEPDDLVQNAMLRVLKRLDAGVPPRGWLYMAVRSCASDACRRATIERRFMCLEEPDFGLVSENADEYNSFEGACSRQMQEKDLEIDLLPRLKNMLEKLSKPLRQVLVLHSEGYSYQEIAALTNTNLGTVRSRLHYARRRAKGLLGDQV